MQFHKEINKPYRLCIAHTQQVICSVIWLGVDKACFLRPGHIYVK